MSLISEALKKARLESARKEDRRHGGWGGRGHHMNGGNHRGQDGDMKKPGMEKREG